MRMSACDQYDVRTRCYRIVLEHRFYVANQQLFGCREALATGKRCAIIGHAHGEIHQMSQRGKRSSNMPGASDQQYRIGNKWFDKYLRPGISCFGWPGD